MSLKNIISKVNSELISSFASLDGWFDKPEEVLHEKPSSGWSAAEILEHVMLTNHFLLILIEKGSKRAIELAAEQNLTEVLKDYSLASPALEEVGQHGSFYWQRPDHMQPRGEKPLSQVRHELRDQLYRCLTVLDDLSNGQGVAYKITMTVNGLGKLDMYQYLYFLALHARRHVAQVERLIAASV